MKIEILSGTYEIDNEAREFVTAAEEATVASLAQKLIIRKRRQAEKEEKLRQQEELKRINRSRVINGLPPIHDLSELSRRER